MTNPVFGEESSWQKQAKHLLWCTGCALCFFSGVGLLRSKLRQTGTEEETAFVPQACLTARKTLKTGWRGVWYSEIIIGNWKLHCDSLFLRFSWFLLKSYLPCATTFLTNYGSVARIDASYPTHGKYPLAPLTSPSFGDGMGERLSFRIYPALSLRYCCGVVPVWSRK